ncbi:unnamed protein product [Didymodactylos carnosus]|uniref:Uncharacterized protein n=1 Tax=Didymodactylos carnosus TaxID=1234261 RepID=A0A814MF40_9BILA|nr:unnamed protein product [Didymodactylos carnosus]CAF1488895.1 unnamed protein product [Didymodactylos carnosus]CAF3843888.1 unnamed protein product [Didymodactylos carnosus]CAF4278275.1 unnamed protein product [Didymodactylos carnosus]
MSSVQQPCDRHLDQLLSKNDRTSININAGIDSGHSDGNDDAKLGFLAPDELEKIHSSPHWQRLSEIAVEEQEKSTPAKKLSQNQKNTSCQSDIKN